MKLALFATAFAVLASVGFAESSSIRANNDADGAATLGAARCYYYYYYYYYY
jgi:hypothetical protein